MKPIDRLLQRWRINKARPYIPAGSRVLDIGCAGGELFRHVPEVAEGVGVDPDLSPAARSVPQAVLLKGFFPQVLPDNRPFDVITLLAVLEHVAPEQQQALAVECARHLKPGGYLVITVPSQFVDIILLALRFFRLIHGMALEQHYGYDPRQTAALFTVPGMELIEARRFQLGLNNLFVFRRTANGSEVPLHARSAKQLFTRRRSR